MDRAVRSRRAASLRRVFGSRETGGEPFIPGWSPISDDTVFFTAVPLACWS
jgi:hypothetical protein